MTVNELIDRLKSFDGDAIVKFIYSDDLGYNALEVECVDIKETLPKHIVADLPTHSIRGTSVYLGDYP
jgi:hypothetical protein